MAGHPEHAAGEPVEQAALAEARDDAHETEEGPDHAEVNISEVRRIRGNDKHRDDSEGKGDGEHKIFLKKTEHL